MPVSKQDLLDAIEKDNTVLSMLIVHIYRNQTNEEQAVHATTEDNGIGFNGTDAQVGTSLAERYLRGIGLTQAQLHGKDGQSGALRMMRKYAAQAIHTGFEWIIEEPKEDKYAEFDRACEKLLDISASVLLEIVHVAIRDHRESIGKRLDMSDESLEDIADKLWDRVLAVTANA